MNIDYLKKYRKIKFTKNILYIKSLNREPIKWSKEVLYVIYLNSVYYKL